MEIWLEFEWEYVKLQGEVRSNDWRNTWKTVKLCFKKCIEKLSTTTYQQKAMQSKIYQKQDQNYNLWFEQNVTTRNTTVTVSMLSVNDQNKNVKSFERNYWVWQI